MPIKGGKILEETKKKISLAHRGMRHSEETKKKISLAHRGIRHSEDAKKKMSLSHRGKFLNEKNSMWKGNDVGCAAMHRWIKYRKSMPKLCVCCGKNKPYDLANISGKYRRDVNDYEWLCRRCHMHKDGRMFNLKQNQNEVK